MSENEVRPSPDATIELREITDETLLPILKLKVHPNQERFVANNAVSIAQAHFSPHAWFRGIYADETAVGFTMMYELPDKPEYYLWRFMIGADYQRMGFGMCALKLLIERVRRLPNATELCLGYNSGEGNPQPFYRRCGFEETGEEKDGERIMRFVF